MKKFLLLILLTTVTLTMMACNAEEIIWADMVLGEILPEPPANKGTINDNSAENLWLDINDISNKQFNDYIEVCKEKGFSIDVIIDSYSFEAYNSDGYKLSLDYYSDSEMTIDLEAPMEMDTISWPTSPAGKQLPTPKSTVGCFDYEYADSFLVYMGNTSKTDYADYINACSEKGFNIDYSKDENYYYAENNEGWSITVCYEGYNIMSIDICAPSNYENDNYDADSSTESDIDVSTTVTTETTETDTTMPIVPETTLPVVSETTKIEQDTVNNSGLDPDFKAAMDSYEKFIDEYIAFMKKYEANPSDLSLLVDYADYVSKYTVFASDFQKWNNEELNDTELAYYIDVQARVSKKLLELAS